MPRHLKEQAERRALRARIKFDPYLGRTNSVTRSIAETKTQQQPVSQEEALMSRVNIARVQFRKGRQDLYYCFLLQVEYSLRISEVLGITPEDITAWGEIRIRGKKGSENRMINPDSVREFVLRKKAAGINPFGELHEDFVRRSYREAGLFYRAPGRKKDSVTHIFRHLAAISARKNNFGSEVITRRLAHKSSKSQESYGK